ncbi:DNA-3-methyladenine glycosylase I [soil metagenome]
MAELDATSGALEAECVVGDDGFARCPWLGASGQMAPDYRDYHDHEWGRPVHDEQALLERLCLEAFQSGLSWLTILRKRAAFREEFAAFVPEEVAAYGADDVERLMQQASIVRNRRKIDATIANARATIALRESGGLGDLFWSARADHPGRARPVAMSEVPASTPASAALAKTLKSAGFAHLGPTTVYAAMQACGVVDDHLAGCFRAGDTATS